MLLLYKTHIFLLIYKDKTGNEIILQMSNYCLYARIDEVIKDRRADNEIEREIAEKEEMYRRAVKRERSHKKLKRTFCQRLRRNERFGTACGDFTELQ